MALEKIEDRVEVLLHIGGARVRGDCVPFSREGVGDDIEILGTMI